ncbi:hypothetical protein M0802_006435 [Mischocyttarus mexicanus]|nr:hypothetical protein M0802_006435 [Mischocyttarus mexicanus]
MGFGSVTTPQCDGIRNTESARATVVAVPPPRPYHQLKFYSCTIICILARRDKREATLLAGRMGLASNLGRERSSCRFESIAQDYVKERKGRKGGEKKEERDGRRKKMWPKRRKKKKKKKKKETVQQQQQQKQQPPLCLG